MPQEKKYLEESELRKTAPPKLLSKTPRTEKPSTIPEEVESSDGDRSPVRTKPSKPSRRLELREPVAPPQIIPTPLAPTRKDQFSPTLNIKMPYVAEQEKSKDLISSVHDIPDLTTHLRVIKSSRECLTYKRDNYVHFISPNCEPVSTVTKLLVAIGGIDLNEMRDRKPNSSQILTTPRSKHKIYSVVVKQHYADRITEAELETSLSNLLVALKKNGVNQFRISRYVDFCDELPRNSLTDTVTRVFKNTGIKVVVCHGKVEIPALENRQAILAEYHDSLLSGQKGITKTNRRIKERFTWPRLRDDVIEFIRKCPKCAKEKITRMNN